MRRDVRRFPVFLFKSKREFVLEFCFKMVKRRFSKSIEKLIFLAKRLTSIDDDIFTLEATNTSHITQHNWQNADLVARG